MGLERLWIVGVTVATALCLLRTSQSADPVVRARVGGFAELACSLAPLSSGATTPRLFPLHVVEWVRLGYNVPVLIKFGVYTPRVHPNYRGRVSLTKGASLLVEGLRLEDEGWFECRILLLDRTSDEFRNGTWTFLSITAPPVFIKAPPPFLEAMHGDSLALTCGAHGNPRPTVTWKKDDISIEKQDNVKVLNGTLSLESVTRETAGMYKCHISNTEGNLTHSTQLLVKGPPIIVIPPEDTTLNMSQDAVLRCQAEAYPVNLSYVWWKEGENVYHIESLKSRVKILVDGTLLIPSLTPDDSGNYTCMPTNGLLTPPAASAYLTVKHPAQVVRMPRETYLPAGMVGVIACPVRAEPPMLFVNWTKDGDLLNLDMFPGWMVNSEGSVFIAAANDDAVGRYTCTAYNSYGTMGQSDPTTVVLQDPPSFKVPPRAEYLQEVGRELLIPCEAHGDPAPNITWSKIGPIPRSQYSVAANGSLLLRPVSKVHQGQWECRATNRVATVSASTIVLVLGTSPHAVSSVSVIPGINQANVSWEPGFDGGYTQKFSVWLKQASRGKHEWTSLPVSASKSWLLVTGLLPGTNYQLSILSQNKLGSGPFSEIATVRTLVPLTDPPPVVTTIPKLVPPSSLSTNQTEKGIFLQWALPRAQSPPITGFVLQARRDTGDWLILNGNISANQSEMLVQGLLKDSSYELRLLSLRNKLLSEPSESVNISTAGMEVYPARTSLLEFVTEPLLAGVVGGVCFLFVAIILSLLTACVMSHRRDRRHRKRRDDIPTVLQKSPPTEALSPTDSPDSLLKMKLCPPLSFFPNSSSSQSDRSSFDKGSRNEYQDQRRQLLSSSSPPPRYALFESHLGGFPSPTSALESISRGPDGRFIVQPYEEGSAPAHIKKNLKKDFPQISADDSSSVSNRLSYRYAPISESLCSELDEKKHIPQERTVGPSGPSKSQYSPGRVREMARNFSRHGCFCSDDGQGYTEGLLELTSFYSDNGEKRDSLKKYCASSHPKNTFLSLSKKAREPDLAQESKRCHSSCLPMEMESQITETSALWSRPDRELEDNSLSRCLKLAQEREEMEKELEQYITSQRAQEREKEAVRVEGIQASHAAMGAEAMMEEPVWKLQEVSLCQKNHHATEHSHQLSDYRKGCYFGNTSSPMGEMASSSSYIHWDVSPVTSVTNLVPVQSCSEQLTREKPLPMKSEATGDSLAVDCSRSPVTQYTSLSLLSPASKSVPLSPHLMDSTEVKSKCPEQKLNKKWESFNKRPVPKKDSRIKGILLLGGDDNIASKPNKRTPTPRTNLFHDSKRLDRNSTCDVEREQDRSFSPHLSQSDFTPEIIPERPEGKGVEMEHQSIFETCTLPYELLKAGVRVNYKTIQNNAGVEPGDILLSPEFEKENARVRLRKSDKCLYGESPSRTSPLTLIENDNDSERSDFSVARISDSFKSKLAPQPSKISLLQTTAILEYLSLPGFIEMSVDDPVEESDAADSTWSNSDHRTGSRSQDKPDVVPKDWDIHKPEMNLSQKCSAFPEDKSSGSPTGDSGPECIRSALLKARDSSLRWKMGTSHQDPKQLITSEHEVEQDCYEEPKSVIADKTLGSETRPVLGLSSVQIYDSAAKGLETFVSKTPEQFSRRVQSASDQSQILETQGHKTNRICSRIHQAPLPFIKKSISMGQSISLSAVGHPIPLKKSISLGSQKWEHFESLQNYAKKKNCNQDELPNPDVRVKSFSLGHCSESPFSSRLGPYLRGSTSYRPQSSSSLKNPPYAERSIATPPSLTLVPPAKDLPKLPAISDPTTRQSPDPRRQATASPDASQWPITYKEALKSAQHVSALRNSSGFQIPSRPGMRWEYPRTQGYKRGPQRLFLPRGYSWPSPYHSLFIPREPEIETVGERWIGKGVEADIKDCKDAKEGRASYASQSSGRGSMGPSYTHALLRQSLSLTPTLPSSPKTTEESERRGIEMDMHKWRPAKRRNALVDESYEWDAADFPVDILKAPKVHPSLEGLGRGRRERRRDHPCSTAGLWDLQTKGLFPSVSPLVCAPPRGLYTRSLSEARFNALRQEYQEYRRALKDPPGDPCLSPKPNSDPDPNTVLL